VAKAAGKRTGPLVPTTATPAVAAARATREGGARPRTVTKVVDDEPTSYDEPTIVRTVTLDITDGSLSMVVGGRSESTGEYAYTFLGFLEIEPVD
jgi:hypothetical protein